MPYPNSYSLAGVLQPGFRLLDASWLLDLASGKASLANLSLTGYLAGSSADTLTAFAGGGQAGALQLTASQARVTTVATAGDSVRLPQAIAGISVAVENAGANTMQVFGYGTDTIAGVATAVGVPQYAGEIVDYFCFTTGTWSVSGVSNKAAAFNTNTATSAATLTVANITGGFASVDLAMTGTLAGAAALTLPTAAALYAALPGPPVGTTYRLRIINQSAGAFAWTVTTNTGWTLTGTMSIAQNTWREFLVTQTSSTAATLQSLATGTFS